MTNLAPAFKGKPEFDTVPFDPNIRHRIDTIPNDMLYRGLDGLPPYQPPRSAYLSIMHKGKRYHLFDASKISLGRMARMIAVFIRGKHKPTYNAATPEIQGDVCVVVNARMPKVVP